MEEDEGWQRALREVLVPEEEVAERIRVLGEQISKDYAGRQVHMICVLKGSVFFMCEIWPRELPFRYPWTL